MLGFDASKYQTAERVKLELAKPEIRFGIINASTGAQTVSPMLATHRANLRASGKLAGYYHWLMFEQRDAKVEAAHFANTVDFLKGETGWMDCEQWSYRKKADGTTEKYVPDHAPSFVIEMNREFRRLKGFDLGAYLNYFWLSEFHRLATAAEWQELTALPLWLSYPNGKPGNWATSGWSTYGWEPIVHQYAFKDASGGDWDADWFGGGPTLWKSLGKP